MTKNLESIANSIPSMGGREIGHFLRRYASLVPKDGAIVEVGVWLGAGTAQLALGVLDSGENVPIYCYDLFMTFPNHLTKAEAQGVQLQVDQNLLPIVKEKLDQFNVNIVYNKGDIREAKYNGKKIYLFVDDAAKSEDKFNSIMNTFSPHFIPYDTIVVLMDYHYYEKKGDKFLVQKKYMENNKRFEYIQRLYCNTSAAVFRFLG